jgi:hypothetical protein
MGVHGVCIRILAQVMRRAELDLEAATRNPTERYNQEIGSSYVVRENTYSVSECATRFS